MQAKFKEQIPSYAKDLKLNLNSVLNQTPGSELTENQIMLITLACAYATRNATLINAISKEAQELLDENAIQAAKAGASIMAMNNVYYRFIHLNDDKEFQSMPANLRMNIIANPGINSKDFELLSLAVSAINGCGLCINAHASTLQKSGISKAAIQHAIRIAALLNGLGQVAAIEQA